MTDGKLLLETLLKDARLAQIYIRNLLHIPMDPGLREILKGQYREFDTIETDARLLAIQRGWEPREADAALLLFCGRLIRVSLRTKDADSRIAGRMILRYTRAMIRERRNSHAYTGRDPSLGILCRKLLDCETAAIRSLQRYL